MQAQSTLNLKQGKLQLRIDKKIAVKVDKNGGNFREKDIKYQNQLDRKYFRQEVVDLAKSLLGKLFIRETPQGSIKAVIVQT